MPQIPASHRHCPAGHSLAVLGDRWSMLIVREALDGRDRYQEFRDVLGISDNTLTRRLGHLQDAGILTRGTPESGEYRLTDAGRDLARVLAVLGDWAMNWMPVDTPLRPVPQAVVDAGTSLGLAIPAPEGEMLG
ncbi:MAG: helix-turn-helix domain-containing protein [Actinomycetota bacterium]